MKQTVGPTIFFYFFKKRKGLPRYCIDREIVQVDVQSATVLPFPILPPALFIAYEEKEEWRVCARPAQLKAVDQRASAPATHTHHTSPIKGNHSRVPLLSTEKKNKKNVRRIAHGSRREHVKRFVHDEPTPKS